MSFSAMASSSLAEELRANGVKVESDGVDDVFRCPCCESTARIVYLGTGEASPVHCDGGCTGAEIRVALSGLRDAATPLATGPVGALDAARVDLVKLASRPPRPRGAVPGAEGLVLRGKRHLWVASAGVGKSLAMLVMGVKIVEAGGHVAIIDVENGSDEYARRLRDVLAARGTAARDSCAERLDYYEYPVLRSDWSPESWSKALEDRDLVVFDSSRLVCSSLGLAEDKSDDYGDFVNTMLIPLSKAGIATLVLDNTGHADQSRARGTSAKEDLNEVMFALTAAKRFDRQRTGQITFARKRTRFGDGIVAEFSMTVGGGAYEMSTAMSKDGIPGAISDAALDILRAGGHASVSAALGVDKLIAALRDHGVRMRATTMRKQLRELAENPDGGIEYQSGRGYFTAVPSAGRSTSVPVPGRTGTDDPAGDPETAGGIRDHGAVPQPGTHPDDAVRPPSPPMEGDGGESEART